MKSVLAKGFFHLNFVKKDEFILSGTSIFKKQLGGKTVLAHIKPTLEIIVSKLHHSTLYFTFSPYLSLIFFLSLPDLCILESSIKVEINLIFIFTLIYHKTL